MAGASTWIAANALGSPCARHQQMAHHLSGGTDRLIGAAYDGTHQAGLGGEYEGPDFTLPLTDRM